MLKLGSAGPSLTAEPVVVHPPPGGEVMQTKSNSPIPAAKNSPPSPAPLPAPAPAPTLHPSISGNNSNVRILPPQPKKSSPKSTGKHHAKTSCPPHFICPITQEVRLKEIMNLSFHSFVLIFVFGSGNERTSGVLRRSFL